MNSPTTVQTGNVKFFASNLNYGFISPDDEGPDLFFHAKQIVAGAAAGNPASGDKVEFIIGRSNDGRPRAERVRVLAR
jgi:cold shock CspA family protein